MNDDRDQIRIRLRKDALRRLAHIAVDDGKSRQQLIAEILDNYLTTNCHDHIAQQRPDQNIAVGHPAS